MNKLIFRLSAFAILSGSFVNSYAESSLCLSEASIAPGSVGSVTISLNNDVVCRGLSSRITLPEGLTVIGINPTDADADCMVNINTTPGLEQFYLLPSGKLLEPGAGAVCKLTLAASNSFKGGSLILHDASIVDESYSDRKLSECRGYVSSIGFFSVTIPDFMILPGETKRLDICLDN
ncbi:MAG: hypothetical protein K2H85_03820, partial [Allobaculum sp.]|nr:hypothetical protein [Allobaculum sp.]